MDNHSHKHGENCGHTKIKHSGHIDYLHNGDLHHNQDDDVQKHLIEVSKINPIRCTPRHFCRGHKKDHQHGDGCGHEAVPHGDHLDYIVDGHLHNPHGEHCDNHGNIEVVTSSTEFGMQEKVF